MKEYLIIWIDYKTDKTRRTYIEADSKEEAESKFKLSSYKYWRIVEVIEA